MNRFFKSALSGASFALGGLLMVGVASAALDAMPRTLTKLSMDQPSLYTFLNNVTTKVNAIDASVDSNVTAVTELMTDHDADNDHMDDLKTLVNDIRTHLTGDRLFSGAPALAIDTNFDVQTANAVQVSIDGVVYNVAAATLDTGTSAMMAADTWACLLVSANTSGALVATWDDNGNSGYASEALAITACEGNLPASQAPVGYVTVLTASGQTWTAGTDALQGGTGGNPSDDTNYYNLADPLQTVSAAVSTSAAADLAASSPTAVSETDGLTLSR